MWVCAYMTGHVCVGVYENVISILCAQLLFDVKRNKTFNGEETKVY